MIEARTNSENATPKATTPEIITTSMILEDLENGIDRTGIKEKYNLQAWEVKQMFEHPVLKGKKARKVRKMSFNFVDDTTEVVDPNQTSIPMDSTPAEDFHNNADLRTQDAIQDNVAIEEENPHYENPQFTKSQEDQMYGQAWEEQIQAETTNNLNL